MSGSQGAPPVTIKISAQDDTAAGMKSVQKKLEGLEQDTNRLRFELPEAAWKGAEKLSNATMKAGYGALKAGAGLAAVGATGVVGGIIYATEHVMGMGAEALRASQRLGMSVDTLTRFQVGAELAGASSEEATAGLAGLQQTMNAAVHGQDNEAFSVLHNLGIDIGNFTSGAKNAASVLPKIAEATERLFKVNPEAAAHFLDLVGVGRQLLFVFKDGAPGLETYLRQADEAGHLTQEQAEKSRELEIAQTKLGLTFRNFGTTMGGSFAPALTELLKQFQSYTLDHKDDVVGFFKSIETSLESITKPENMAAFRRTLDEVTADAKELWKYFQQLEHSPLLRKMLGLPEEDTPETRALKEPGNRPFDATVDPENGFGDHGAVEQELERHGTRTDGILNRFFRWVGIGGDGGTPASAPGAQSAPGASTATPSADHGEFYNTYTPAAQKAGAALGVDPKVILAQWAVETGYGRNVHDFNLGNIQAGEGYAGRTVVRGDTHADGTPYETKFRAYDTPDQFADDYVALIKRRYAAALGSGDDAQKYGDALKAGGYMEDPAGPAKIAAAHERVARELIAERHPAPDDPNEGHSMAAPPEYAMAGNDRLQRLRVELSHTNAPPGSKIEIDDSDIDPAQIQVAPPKVQTAMPLSGPAPGMRPGSL